MHRRQGDLLEIHPCVLQDLPVTFQAFSHKSLQRQLQLLQLLQRHSSLSRHSRHSSLSSLSRHSSHSRHSRDIPDIPVIHDLPASPGNSSNSTSSSISRDSTHSSILQLECIFYNFYSSIGFHRNSTEYQLNNYKHYILQRKGDVAISVKLIGKIRCQDDILFRIELIPSFVLSSDNTNYNNVIQLFLQLFDE